MKKNEFTIKWYNNCVLGKFTFLEGFHSSNIKKNSLHLIILNK